MRCATSSSVAASSSRPAVACNSMVASSVSGRRAVAAFAPSPALRRHSQLPSPALPSPSSGVRQQSRGSVACQGLFGLGLPEIAVIAGIAVLVFGPSKLPELGKGLGKTVKSFQTAAKEFETELKAATAEDGSAATPAAAKPAEEAKKEATKSE